MKLFNRKNNNLVSIAIENETYVKLKTISDLEKKNFTEIIEEGFRGKKIVL